MNKLTSQNCRVDATQQPTCSGVRPAFLWIIALACMIPCSFATKILGQQTIRYVPIRNATASQTQQDHPGVPQHPQQRNSVRQFQGIQSKHPLPNPDSQPLNQLRRIRDQQSAGFGSKVIEAETLRVKKSGGTIGAQNMQQFGSWSGGYQLIWTGNAIGQRLELPLQADVDGVHHIVMHITRASDFGDLSIGMQGRQLSTFSGFSTRVEKTTVDLGNIALRRGTNTLIVNVTGKVSRSSGYGVGIDRIDITPQRTTTHSNQANFPGSQPHQQNPGRQQHGNGQSNMFGLHPNVILAPGNPGTPLQDFGPTLLRQQNNQLTKAPYQIQGWGHHSSVVRFRWDATSIPDCRAVIWQVSTERPENIYIKPGGSPLVAFQFDGIVGFGINGQTTLQENKGQFHFEFRKFGHLITDPATQRFYVQVLPINHPGKRTAVGQQSNYIEIIPPKHQLIVFNPKWMSDSTQQKFSITRLTAKQNSTEQLEDKINEDHSGSNVIDKISGGSSDDDDDN